MTFRSLLFSVTWADVSIALVAAYPDTSISDLVGYSRVRDILYSITPVPSTTRISINWVDPDPRFSEPDDVGYWDVSGLDDVRDAKEGYETPMKWAIEFTPWGEWLGMEIDKDTLAKLSPADILAHCLWEMTFCGYTQEEVDGELKKIEDAVKDTGLRLLSLEDI